MSSALVAARVYPFVIFVGILSASFFDFWWLLLRAMGMIVIDWGLVGRWVAGICRGRTDLCDSCRATLRYRAATGPGGFAVQLLCGGRKCPYFVKPSAGEFVLGRLLHYACCMACALLLIVVCGPGYRTAPRLLPALVVGTGVVSAADLCIAVPRLLHGHARGCGHVVMVNALLLSGNVLFGLALYASARLAAHIGI